VRKNAYADLQIAILARMCPNVNTRKYITMKVNKLTLNSPDYPEILRDLALPPKQLFVMGDLTPLLVKPRLAVVGSRKVTPYGKLVTTQLAGEIARKGVVIVSGLALGVDALAHAAALDNGGLTLAVLANGLPDIQPKTNHHLAMRILKQGGAIVSEYPEGAPPLRENFIARNRIVSGLSDGVLITEAAAKSGTMHTANFALEQGRAVMAVPGNIHSPLSEGTNNLIKTGAIPVTTSADILLALGLSDSHNRQTELFGSTKEEVLILTLLQSGLTDASELLRNSKLAAAEFNQTLTMLEITGKIRPLGAGHWSLT
jgi:DNA processing protein